MQFTSNVGTPERQVAIFDRVELEKFQNNLKQIFRRNSEPPC